MAKKRNYSSELQKAEVPQRRQRQSQRPERSKPAPKKKKEKEITNYTQDFINIKDIRNGIIETYDNRYIKIIEVEPINFMLRTGEEQNNIIFAFAGWFKIANIKLQFKSITKKADSERHIELLKKDMVGETVEQAKELSKAYIKLIRDVGSQEALTRRFFFIMEYEPFNNSSKANEYTEIYQTLQSAAQTFKSYLGQCGNNVLVHKNEDIFLGETLYMFFNRRSSIDEPFNSRVQRVIADTMTSKGRILGKDEVPAIPVVNYIAPRGLDLSHIGYMVMDGMYYTFLYIKSNGYPDSVRAGWMSALVNAGEGIDIDIHFKKESKSKAIDKVAQKIRLNKIKMKSTYDTQGDYEELRDSIASGYYIKEALSSGGEDLWYMSIIVTLSSKTLDGLQWKKKTLADMLKARDMEAAELKFRQEQAFKSVIPLLELDKDIFNKSKRNVTTSTAASSYMFTSFEMSDDNGILLGVNEHNSSLVILDIFNSKMYKNANMCIIGTSGAGKTFTEQLMALRMRMRGIQVFILAPLKGHEFRRACVNIGGQYVKISPGSPHCINIMEIRIPDTSSDELIEGEGAIEEDSWLARKMQQLNISFSLLIPDMTNEEEQLLDEAIIDTYAIKGITNDNDSIFIDGTDKKKKMPVLGDLYNQLNNNEMTKRLAIIVSRFVTGSAQSFNNQTNVDLDNKYIVMDISELKGKLLPVGMFIALDYVWDKTKEDRTKKKAIFIDETWMLIGASSNKYAAEFVLEVFKIIRGYGGAAIAATQDLGDFFALEGGKYGKGIVNNSKTKIILQLEPDEAEFVKETMKLSKNEYRNIIGFERGHGLIASNNNKVPVAIKPSETEKALITTDRAELAAQAEAQVNEAKKREKAARDQEMAAKRNTQ
jgi:hypothetical protein